MSNTIHWEGFWESFYLTSNNMLEIFGIMIPIVIIFLLARLLIALLKIVLERLSEL